MDLHKIARVTRLNKLSKGRMLLIAAAVTWSTLNCSLDNSPVLFPLCGLPLPGQDLDLGGECPTCPLIRPLFP